MLFRYNRRRQSCDIPAENQHLFVFLLYSMSWLRPQLSMPAFSHLVTGSTRHIVKSLQSTRRRLNRTLVCLESLTARPAETQHGPWGRPLSGPLHILSPFPSPPFPFPSLPPCPLFPSLPSHPPPLPHPLPSFSFPPLPFLRSRPFRRLQRLCSSAYGALQICLWLWLWLNPARGSGGAL